MLEGITLVIIIALTFSFIPFTGSLLVPTPVRVLLLLLLVIISLGFTWKKKNSFWFLIILGLAGAPLGVIWFIGYTGGGPSILYFFCFVSVALGLNALVKRQPVLSTYITVFYHIMVMCIAVLAIIAFITFNFHILPFTFVKLADSDYYNYFYNPLVGYIDPKEFESGMIGRVAGLMFEPSYMAWFLTCNFFMMDAYVRKKGIPLLISKAIVFLGVLSTASTAAMLTIGMLFSLQACFYVLKLLGVEKLKQIITWVLVIAIPVVVLFMPKENVDLGASSLGDREGRMQSSLLLIASASPKEILLGRGPGYIENSDAGKGESNQLLKMFVEEGAILSLLITGFICYCTKHNPYFMLANLIFLNSVVILLTPLFIINILVCKWYWDKMT